MIKKSVQAAAIALMSIVLFGCGANVDLDVSKPRTAAGGIAHSKPLEASRAAVDEGGNSWILGEQDGRMILFAYPASGDPYLSIDLGPTKIFGSIGVAMVSDDVDGVVLAAVHCVSGDGDPEICDDAALDTTQYVLGKGEIIAHQWASSAPVERPEAVLIAGLAPGSLAFRSGATIVSRERAMQAGPTPASPVCLAGGSAVSVEYLDDEENATSTIPPEGAPTRARLRRYVDGGWAVIGGSDISYPWSTRHTLDLRCGIAGIQLSEEGQPAERIWDGSSWVVTNAKAARWLTYDAPPTMTVSARLDRNGLIGIDHEGNVVRVDSTTGRELVAAVAPAGVSHWWDPGRPGLRDGIIALGSSKSPVIVSCPTGSAQATSCDIWSEDR